MIIIKCRQGSEAWHQSRCGVVTASNFSKVIAGGRGKTRQSYMQRLAEEIITGRRAETYWNNAMKRGVDLEPVARQAYEEHKGASVEEIGFAFLCAERRVGASPDGLIGEDGGIEIKCPLPATHEKYRRTGTIPAAYRAQIQGNMWITGRSWWDFVSYMPGTPLLIQRIWRDETYIKNLSQEIGRFLEELDRQINAATIRRA